MKTYSVASADIQSGKQAEAWAWAIKAAAYADANNPVSGQIEVLQNVTGRGNRITWVTKHESLGDAEKSREWSEADEGFQKLIAESVDQDLMDWSTLDRTYFRIRS